MIRFYSYFFFYCLICLARNRDAIYFALPLETPKVTTRELGFKYFKSSCSKIAIPAAAAVTIIKISIGSLMFPAFIIVSLGPYYKF